MKNIIKKIILALSLFFAVAVSAQSTQHKEVNNETKKEITSAAFTGVNLTSSQETKVKALNNKGLTQSSYNSKMKRILNKSQYNKYLANTKQSTNENSKAYKSDEKESAKNSEKAEDKREKQYKK